MSRLSARAFGLDGQLASLTLALEETRKNVFAMLEYAKSKLQNSSAGVSKNIVCEDFKF